MQKYETAAERFDQLQDDELVDGLANVQDDASSNDEEQENYLEEDADGMGTEEDEETDDYNMFATMMTVAKQAIVERKKLWEQTGDSFVLDHFSESMRVTEWVKQNLNDTVSVNMDISKIYGDMCKERKKFQSTFLDQDAMPVRKRATPRKSKSVEPLSPISKHSDTTSRPPPNSARCLSESTYNRRRGQAASNKRSMLQSVRRLSTVAESPSAAAAAGYKGSPIRRTGSIGDLKLPRQRMVIYSPMQPIVQEQFKSVLKKEWFDPNRMLVYEPPSDANSTSESDDDIFLACKRKYGGKIYEI